MVTSREIEHSYSIHASWVQSGFCHSTTSTWTRREQLQISVQSARFLWSKATPISGFVRMISSIKFFCLTVFCTTKIGYVRRKPQNYRCTKRGWCFKNKGDKKNEKVLPLVINTTYQSFANILRCALYFAIFFLCILPRGRVSHSLFSKGGHRPSSL